MEKKEEGRVMRFEPMMRFIKDVLFWVERLAVFLCIFLSCFSSQPIHWLVLLFAFTNLCYAIIHGFGDIVQNRCRPIEAYDIPLMFEKLAFVLVLHYDSGGSKEALYLAAGIFAISNLSIYIISLVKDSSSFPDCSVDDRDYHLSKIIKWHNSFMETDKSGEGQPIKQEEKVKPSSKETNNISDIVEKEAAFRTLRKETAARFEPRRLDAALHLAAFKGSDSFTETDKGGEGQSIKREEKAAKEEELPKLEKVEPSFKETNNNSDKLEKILKQEAALRKLRKEKAAGLEPQMVEAALDITSLKGLDSITKLERVKSIMTKLKEEKAAIKEEQAPVEIVELKEESWESSNGSNSEEMLRAEINDNVMEEETVGQEDEGLQEAADSKEDSKRRDSSEEKEQAMSDQEVLEAEDDKENAGLKNNDINMVLEEKHINMLSELDVKLSELIASLKEKMHVWKESFAEERSKWDEERNDLLERLDFAFDHLKYYENNERRFEEEINSLYSKLGEAKLQNGCYSLKISGYEENYLRMVEEKNDLSEKLKTAQGHYFNLEETCSELRNKNSNLSEDLRAESSLVEHFHNLSVELEEKCYRLQQEKANLAANLSAAEVSVELYKDYLHDMGLDLI